MSFESDPRCTPIAPITCGAAPRQPTSAQRVRLSGWVHRKRDHGGVLFVDLRDHYGLTQIVADAEQRAASRCSSSLRAESVVTIDGEVVARGAEATNPNLPTGEIEVVRRERRPSSRPPQELPLPVAGEAGLSRGYPPPLPLPRPAARAAARQHRAALAGDLRRSAGG